jgi:hypothetical protein
MAEAKKRGWSYLDGNLWSEVTRDERFFCARLYALEAETPGCFIRALNRIEEVGIELSEDEEWEVGLEVCFFRDHRHAFGTASTATYYSPKRTFDLCLFSSNRVVIVEAKAQQDFSADSKQLGSFANDVDAVKKALGVERVDLLVLSSGRSHSNSVLDKLNLKQENKFSVTWKALAEKLGNDRVLLRADSLYKPAMMLGRALVDHKGDGLWIGCKGGAAGLTRLLNGKWEERLFEVRQIADPPANLTNWFSLDHFRGVVASGQLP